MLGYRTLGTNSLYRFHSVPTFAHDTICRLPGNVSELSKLTARDYKDILQVCDPHPGSTNLLLIDHKCSILAFDGLFYEEDNRSISELLFLLATWHAYAKLCLHTDTTLGMLEIVAKALCQALRQFATITCPRYATKELPREVNTRLKRQQAHATHGERVNKTTSNTVKVKQFNLSTYKIHCIPDYLDAIQKYGTTDTYSTQTVSIVCLSTGQQL